MSDRPPSSLPLPASGSGGAAADRRVTGEELSRLKWRCRRGLLENDLFIERFFDRYADRLTARQAAALSELMELGDNDLLDLLLRRKEPQGAINTGDVRRVLEMLRS